MTGFISYVRVSTQKQGQSGLGLEAQYAAVVKYLDGAKLIAEYVEVESGRCNQRPQLEAAIRHAKREKATLVIAKLDRLGRNVHFISGLMESGIEFVAADNPSKDRFMLHIRAAMAEEESRMIRQRTKDALAAAKRRGVKLGQHGKILAKKHHAEAVAYAQSMKPVFDQLHNEGITSKREIAKALNERGIKSAQGGIWHPTTVDRVQERMSA